MPRKVKFMCTIKDLDGLTADEILLITNVKFYPVNIHEVLNKLGIKCDVMDFSPLEAQIPDVVKKRGSILGAVAIIDNKVNIFYSKDSTENRMRFTLAHELAHCCLNAPTLKEGHIEFRIDKDENNPKERAANIFAGQLLIPETPLRQMYDSLIIPAADVMAREFKVSTHVMEARLEYLGLGYYSPKNY